MKAKIFSLLFVLPMLTAGIFAGYLLVADLSDAWRMRAWTPVMAVLESGGYRMSATGEADSLQAYARYRYEVAGVTYYNERVAISDGGDNIGRFQQELGSRLRRAHESGQPVLVYVNPDDHSDAVIERSLRGGLAGFKLLFLLIFGGIAAGLIYVVFRAAPESASTGTSSKASPWLTRPAWRSNRFRSTSRSTMWIAWGFAIFWSLISAPLPFVVYQEFAQNDNALALLGLLFPFIGVGLIAQAIRRTHEWLRYGAAILTLDPFPGAIGGHVGGQLDCRVPLDRTARYQVTLNCIRSHMSGSGKNRRRSESASWHDTQLAHAAEGPLGTCLIFRFDVPDELAESDADKAGDTYHLWRLNVSAELPGTDLDRNYEIPVYATQAESSSLPEDLIKAAQADQKVLDLAALRRLMRIEFGAAGRSLRYPAGRNLGFGLGGSAFGATFAIAGWLLWTHADELLMGVAFTTVGSLILLASLYLMLNSLQCSQEGEDIVSVRRLLGIRINTSRISRAAFAGFDKRSTMSSQSGNRHVMYYTLKAVDHDGRTIVVGEGFRGASQANAAAELVAEAFGLQGRVARPGHGIDEAPANWLAAD